MRQVADGQEKMTCSIMDFCLPLAFCRVLHTEVGVDVHGIASRVAKHDDFISPLDFSAQAGMERGRVMCIVLRKVQRATP